ncbi:MAG: GNAT family N-acetyltransferase [Clostridia bacterium]
MLPASGPVSLRPWHKHDLALLQRMNTAEMWAHLGGPEDDSTVLGRHHRYLEALVGDTRMFAILHHDHAEPVGSIGYWTRRQAGEETFETGWMVVPEAQGQGIATVAARLVIEVLRTDIGSGIVHAYPSVDHPASNAVCRKAGFELQGPIEVEFPAGRFMRVNDWAYGF